MLLFFINAVLSATGTQFSLPDFVLQSERKIIKMDRGLPAIVCVKSVDVLLEADFVRVNGKSRYFTTNYRLE